MRPIILFSSISLFLCCHIVNSQQINISESDFSVAKTVFSELNKTLIKDDGKLWNLSLLGPILLVNRKTRTIIANEPDNEGNLYMQDSLYIGELPENIIIANTAIDWNGKRWTMVSLPLPENKLQRMSLLIHESFHRIQPQLYFDGINQSPNNHLDTKEGRIYLKMELEALKKALISDNPDNHIVNAIKFREYRHQLFPGADTTENQLEIIEGLAEFTGTILCGMGDEALKQHYINQIDMFYRKPSFVRSFAYFTLPVYGFFMRQKEAAWNLKIKRNTNLTSFIAEFYHIKNLEIAYHEIAKIGKNYQMDSIINFEENRENTRLKLVEKYKLQFLGEEVLTIALENMNIGFNPGNIMPLEEYGSVYPNLKITDNWGILEVDSCGALVGKNWDKVILSVPESVTDTLISGKGWKLKLKQNYQLDKNGKGFTVIKK